MVIRIKHGENLLKAHRRHFYQILANEMGIDHWKVVENLERVVEGIIGMWRRAQAYKKDKLI